MAIYIKYGAMYVRVAFSKKLIYFFFSSDLHVADFDIEVNVKVKKTCDKNIN